MWWKKDEDVPSPPPGKEKQQQNANLKPEPAASWLPCHKLPRKQDRQKTLSYRHQT